MRMKRIAVLSMIVLACLSIRIDLYAADTVSVSTAYEAIEDIGSGKYIIPVYIVNNPGLMGFRINVSYDSTELTVDSISRGKITTDGNFNTNVSTAADSGYVSVLWNGTENVSEDGSVMYIGLTVNNDSVQSVNIELDYSQEDTFDAAWKDVELVCYDMEYPIKSFDITETDTEEEDVVADNTTTNEATTNEATTNEATTNEVTTSGYTTEDGHVDGSSVEDADTNNETVIRNSYSESTIPESVYAAEIETDYLQDAKNDMSYADTASDIGEDVLKRSIARQMKKYNIVYLEDLNSDNEYQFWLDVQDDLVNIEGVDEGSVENIKNVAENIDVSQSDIENADINTQSANSDTNSLLNVKMIVIAVVLIGIFVLFLIMRRRRHG